MSKSQPWDYFPMIPIYAFTSVKKAQKFVRNRIGVDYEFTGKNGECTWYESINGFVLIVLQCEGSSFAKKLGVLAHECTHYAQFYADGAKTTLDVETQAYITQAAMSACVDQIGEEWFTAIPQTSKSSEE